ncbi:hypothetical protein ONZ43_g2858 [Nemania bipapillata]|uniref:Uncharacterized protein n=1 Tax=Nemania bipapillata TaxID=110536 RepID=A0ACC2IZR7_9PEZI|nr:hypothetical protein ONZ43_g2858 [Nemania bipapillata]
MDQFPRLKQPTGTVNSMMYVDPEKEKALRSLVTRSEICLPAPLPENSSSSGGLENTTAASDHSVNKQNTPGQSPGQSSSRIPNPSPDIPPSAIETAEPSISHDSSIDESGDRAHSVMPGSQIPPSHTKLHSYYPLVSHPPAPSSYFPLKPNLILTPPQKTKAEGSDKDTTDHSTSDRAGQSQPGTMYGNRQNKKDQDHMEGPQFRSTAMDKYSRSRSRSQSQQKQPFEAQESYGRGRDHYTGRLPFNSNPSASGGNPGSKSTDRGRTMQRRYEFIDSDDKSYTVLSPVQEAIKKSNDKGVDNTGRESNMTTLTNIIQKCAESSPAQLPARQNPQQQQNKEAASTSATQAPLPQPKVKRRPPPLNLNDPIHVGMVKRSNRYEVEHIAIKSSKAEEFSFGKPPPLDLPQYNDYIRNPPVIPPLDIPSLDALRGIHPLVLYDEWRKNLRSPSTSSQGSIRITNPPPGRERFMTREKTSEDQLPITDYPIAQDTPIVNRVRSRSALGIREEHDKQERQRQISGDSLYTASVYSAGLPSSRGPGILRSATMNDVTHGGRQFSGRAGSRASVSGVMMNDVPPPAEMETLSSPFSPLTPFIMKARGAPAGVARGTKTLFGEHGWLEDTAASGATKPKTEKVGGFLENLKRKAREIADSTSFKPARNTRGSAVNRINISLDAREQSLLYCELEYNLNNALDAYVRAQLNGGRLDASKLSRVADAWAQKGRPKVIGFRYDLETQVDLVMAHINDFRFYGPVQAEGPVAITGLLYAMKTNARYMRVRTFCQPDSVIAKHIFGRSRAVLQGGH